MASEDAEARFPARDAAIQIKVLSVPLVHDSFSAPAATDDRTIVSGTGFEQAGLGGTGALNKTQEIPTDQLPMSERMGCFRLLEARGEGAVDMVYRAADIGDGSIVALNTITVRRVARKTSGHDF